jgi:hypothetical protein
VNRHVLDPFADLDELRRPGARVALDAAPLRPDSSQMGIFLARLKDVLRGSRRRTAR